MKNCEEITLDMERSAFQRLSMKDRLGLRMHISLCKECRKYFKDSLAINELLKKRFSHLSEYTFTQEEKDEMKRKVLG